MKKFLVIPFVAAAFMAVACDNAKLESDGMVDLSVGLEGFNLTTKVTDASISAEKTVNNLQVFIFDSHGARENYGKATASTVKIGCAAGVKNIYAVVNAPDLSSIDKAADLEAAATLLTDNAKNSLVMFGSLKNEEIKSSDNSKTVHVQRMAAKIVLEKITRDFSDESLGAKPMTIDAIYLTDVVKNARFGQNETNIEWMNKLEYVSNDDNSLLRDLVGQNIAQGGSYPSGSAVHTFYAYPNSATAQPGKADALPWSPRHTMLVIEATLDGSKTYYPVYLPVLESNHVYTITGFTVTKRGSEHPWEVVETSDISYSVEVDEWENGGSWAEEI